MKILNKIAIAITLLLCVLTLAGCDALLGGIPGTGSGGGGGGEEQKPDAPQSGKATYTIVYEHSDIDMLELRSKLIKIQGNVSSVSADTAPTKNEIVLGDTTRDITVAAKAELDAKIDASKSDSGYIIYSDGNSVAAYWTHDSYEELALEDLIKECIGSDKVTLTSGVIAFELYDSSDKQWDVIAEQYGDSVASALKTLHDYYDGPRIAGWIANLYDPELGGFYYSRSARDYATFEPDLESTSQALSILSNIGAIPQSKINEMFPEEVRVKIIGFVLKMQSTEDGYFYHPQWPQGRENLNTDRYGRDQGSAESILRRVWADLDGDGTAERQYPYYCSPELKCALHVDTKDSCTFPVDAKAVSSIAGKSTNVTSPLSSVVSSAVAKVPTSTVYAVASSHPNYSSASKFKEWLEEYNKDIFENSGGAHNLAAISHEINAHGYMDVLIKHLNDKQAELFEIQTAAGETPTGAWQSPINYKLVWGVYKYAHIYNTFEKPISLEYAPYMVRSCLEVVKLPADGKYAYNDLMNQWAAITSVIGNIRSFYGEKESHKLYQIVRESDVEYIISNSLEKMLPFKQEDGSFSNNVNGTTSSSIYGVSIALGGVAEGNVNSTHILLNMYNNICSALGCPKVPLADLDDGWDVVDTIVNSERIEKIEVKKEALDFESGNLPSSISHVQKNAGTEMLICDDPDASDRGNVLYFHSPKSTTEGDAVLVNNSGIGGNAYVFNADMYVSSETENALFLQIQFDQTYMLQLKKTSTGIVVQEASTISGDGNTNDLATVKTEEWFNVYVEFYASGDDENELDVPHIKVWVNETLVAVSTNYYNSHKPTASPKNSCASVKFQSLRSPVTKMYIDNVYMSRESLTFDAENEDYPF